MFWLPRRTIACERVLQEEGVYGDVAAGELPIDFIPFDADVLSLELDTAFRARRLGCLSFSHCSSPNPPNILSVSGASQNMRSCSFVHPIDADAHLMELDGAFRIACWLVCS